MTDKKELELIAKKRLKHPSKSRLRVIRHREIMKSEIKRLRLLDRKRSLLEKFKITDNLTNEQAQEYIDLLHEDIKLTEESNLI